MRDVRTKGVDVYSKVKEGSEDKWTALSTDQRLYDNRSVEYNRLPAAHHDIHSSRWLCYSCFFGSPTLMRYINDTR